MSRNTAKWTGEPSGGSGASGGINISFADARYINEDEGFKINSGGNLDMKNKKIVNLLNPSNLQDGATKDYVDSVFVTKTGGSLSGNLDMKNFKVINLADATADTDAISKKIIDKRINENQLLYLTETSLTSNSSLSSLIISASHDSNNAFNATNFTGWSPGVTSSSGLIFNFLDSNHVINKFQYTNGSSINIPTGVIFAASNDNTTFTNLYTTTVVLGTNDTEQINFTNTTAYKYYRISYPSVSTPLLIKSLTFFETFVEIKNLANPSYPYSSANKEYVDKNFARKTLDGNLDMKNFKVINLADATADTDAISKRIIDKRIKETELLYLTETSLTSNTSFASLIISASHNSSTAYNATNFTGWTSGVTVSSWILLNFLDTNHIINKFRYTNGSAINIPAGVVISGTTNNDTIPFTSIYTTVASLPTNATELLNFTNTTAYKYYLITFPVITSALIIKSLTFLDTFVEIKNMGIPTLPYSAVNKSYVDSRTNNVVLRTNDGVIPEYLNMNNEIISNVKDPVANQDAATKNYVDLNFLPLSGTATFLQMNNKQIKLLAEPTANQDAATKSYVDNKPVGAVSFANVDQNIVFKLNSSGVEQYHIKNLLYGSEAADACNYGQLDARIKYASRNFFTTNLVTNASNPFITLSASDNNAFAFQVADGNSTTGWSPSSGIRSNDWIQFDFTDRQRAIKNLFITGSTDVDINSGWQIQARNTTTDAWITLYTSAVRIINAITTAVIPSNINYNAYLIYRILFPTGGITGSTLVATSIRITKIDFNEDMFTLNDLDWPVNYYAPTPKGYVDRLSTVVSSTANGLMTSTDKFKLDNIPAINVALFQSQLVSYYGTGDPTILRNCVPVCSYVKVKNDGSTNQTQLDQSGIYDTTNDCVIINANVQHITSNMIWNFTHLDEMSIAFWVKMNPPASGSPGVACWFFAYANNVPAMEFGVGLSGASDTWNARSSSGINPTQAPGLMVSLDSYGQIIGVLFGNYKKTATTSTLRTVNSANVDVVNDVAYDTSVKNTTLTNQVWRLIEINLVGRRVWVKITQKGASIIEHELTFDYSGTHWDAGSYFNKAGTYFGVGAKTGGAYGNALVRGMSVTRSNGAGHEGHKAKAYLQTPP